jgi:hypothetical protein
VSGWSSAPNTLSRSSALQLQVEQHSHSSVWLAQWVLDSICARCVRAVLYEMPSNAAACGRFDTSLISAKARLFSAGVSPKQADQRAAQDSRTASRSSTLTIMRGGPMATAGAARTLTAQLRLPASICHFNQPEKRSRPACALANARRSSLRNTSLPPTRAHTSPSATNAAALPFIANTLPSSATSKSALSPPP